MREREKNTKWDTKMVKKTALIGILGVVVLTGIGCALLLKRGAPEEEEIVTITGKIGLIGEGPSVVGEPPPSWLKTLIKGKFTFIALFTADNQVYVLEGEKAEELLSYQNAIVEVTGVLKGKPIRGHKRIEVISYKLK